MPRSSYWNWSIELKNTGSKPIKTRISRRREVGRLNTRDSGRSQLNNTLACGMPHQARNIVNVELVHHLLAVLLDGFDAESQFPSDLLIGKSLGDQLKHLGFARS